MKTFLEKKIKRRISNASKRGRYLIMRRRHRGRPGRKKENIKCISCNSRLGEYHNHGLCNKCESKQQDIVKTMHIPKMTKSES